MSQGNRAYESEGHSDVMASLRGIVVGQNIFSGYVFDIDSNL